MLVWCAIATQSPLTARVAICSSALAVPTTPKVKIAAAAIVYARNRISASALHRNRNDQSASWEEVLFPARSKGMQPRGSE
jgi:hypothetical protein